MKKIVTCKDCMLDKACIRQPTSKYPHRRVDDKGRVWNGNQCPDCRSHGGESYKRPTGSNRLSTRKCRKCTQFLPPSQYFYHVDCRPNSFITCSDQEDYMVYL